MIFAYRNLTHNWSTCKIKSTRELVSFGFCDRSVRCLVSAKRSANRSVQTKKKRLPFWLIFGLSPNWRLSETLSETDRLIQQVKWLDALLTTGRAPRYCMSLTLDASRRSGECYQTRSCPCSPSQQALLLPVSGSAACNPSDNNHCTPCTLWNCF